MNFERGIRDAVHHKVEQASKSWTQAYICSTYVSILYHQWAWFLSVLLLDRQNHISVIGALQEFESDLTRCVDSAHTVCVQEHPIYTHVNGPQVIPNFHLSAAPLRGPWSARQRPHRFEQIVAALVTDCLHMTGDCTRVPCWWYTSNYPWGAWSAITPFHLLYQVPSPTSIDTLLAWRMTTMERVPIFSAWYKYVDTYRGGKDMEVPHTVKKAIIVHRQISVLNGSHSTPKLDKSKCPEIWFEFLDTSNVQKFDLNFWTHLKIIEVFTTVFSVFRICLIFQNVNKLTYFRFFLIAWFQNNCSCEPLFLIIHT